MFEPLIKAAQDWLKFLPSAQSAREYINSRIDQVNQEKFQIGFLPPPNEFYLLSQILSNQQMINSGLAYRYVDYLVNEEQILPSFSNHNLIIPIHNHYGKIIAVVGRTILPEEERKKLNLSKYKYTSFNKTSNLFGLFHAKSHILAHDRVFVVEGQFDCIKAHMAGLPNTVAVGGSSLSLEQINLLLRFTDNISILFDQDEAGALACEKIKNHWGNYCNLSFLNLPSKDFKDLDEFVSFGGPAVENWINSLNS